MAETKETASEDLRPGQAIDAAHFNQIGRTKPSLRTRLWLHLKKWWWLHLVVVVCLTFLIVLLLIYVAFPHIAQDGINNSMLEIQSMTISNPTEDTFQLDQTSIARSDSSYHPQLDAFNASLSIADGQSDAKPYAYIIIPAIHATKAATVLVNQTVQIADMEQFIDYSTLVVNSEELQLGVQGWTSLHEMSYPQTTVNYNKNVTMKGLNKLQGFNVTSFQIKLLPEPDGSNMLGTVYIPNPSVMTITMGNVTLSLYVQGTYIGNSTLPDLVIQPGNNTVSMHSIVDQTLVLELISKTYMNGMLPVSIMGNSSVYRGQHLTYFEKALASLTLNVTLNVGEALANIGLA